MEDPAVPRRSSRIRAAVGGYSPLALFYRRHRPRWLWRRTSPFGEATSRYVSEHGLAVKHGPFKGMLFTDRAVGKANHLGAKLLGAYEPAVVTFIGEQAPAHDLFVDLGSGEGFFCVGVARLGPIRVIGYELNAFERGLTSEIADANGVRVETRGRVDQDELNALPEGRLLLLSDIEGLEEDLLDPDAVPRLTEATLMVEIHEQFRPDVVSTLTRRFQATHEIERYDSVATKPGDFTELTGWDGEHAFWAAFDGHLPGQGWMSFTPR
jgi:hypothetical protein